MVITIVYFTFLIVASSSSSIKPIMNTLPPTADHHTDLRRMLFTANSTRSDDHHTDLRKTLFTANSIRFDDRHTELRKTLSTANSTTSDSLFVEDLPSFRSRTTKGRMSLWSVGQECDNLPPVGLPPN